MFIRFSAFGWTFRTICESPTKFGQVSRINQGYPGHRQAMIREEQAFEAAAALQRAEADRLRGKIAQFAAIEPKKTPQGKRFHTAKLDALRTL